MRMPMRILLVEDEPQCAALFRQGLCALHGQDFKITPAGSLESALQRLTDAPCGYDLILLDLDLPDSSGVETVQAVTAKTAAPVVAMTAADETLREAALKAGARELLAKRTLRLEELARTVLKVAAACEAKRRFEPLRSAMCRVQTSLDRFVEAKPIT